MLFKEIISDLIFYYKKMVFKEIISNMILKTKFQIWFFIIKKNDFWRNNFRSDFLLWKTISNLTFYYEKKNGF